MGALEPFLPGCSIDILPSRCSGPLEAFGVNGNGYHRASHCASGFDDEYTWCIDVPPAMCAGGGLYCYYYRDDPPDDCCNEEEGECCPPGVPKCPSKTAGNPVNILNGNNTELETDLEFDTPHKQGFKIYRTYKSRIHRDSPLGMGWTHNYNVILKSMGVQFADAYIIEDESNREHFYQSTPDTEIPGTYEGIMSTKGYLANESDGTFTWHRANGVTYTFNQQLQFIAKEDGIGNVQTLTYDVDGLLESVTDQATGRSIGYFYNADGLIDYITGPITTAVPDGIWVSYQYDIDGNLIFVEYADDGNGSIASGFEYLYEDPYDVHNLTEKRNLAGEFLSRWTYDSMDRAYENVTRDGKGVTINGYGTSNIVVTDAQGVDKTYTIDTINGRRTITYITGEGCSSCGEDAVRYGYDAYRRTNEIEYANGRIDQYADFDETDRYHTEIQAVGTSEERTFYYTYHPDTGDRLTITESSVLESGDKETIFDYDNDGNAVPNENPTTLIHRKIERGFTYDAAGTTVPYEHITLYTYNAKGQVLSVDGPLPGAQDETTYTYDPVTGDLLTETKPLVGTTTYGYDDAGNVTSIANPNGIVTTISYDGRNRQLSSNRNGVTNSFTYTAAGELNTTTDALNRTIDYTYNDAGFMDKIIDPSGNFIYYGYNSLGQRTEDSIYGPGDIQTHYRGTDYGDPAGNPDLVSGKPWKSIHRNHDDTADLETVYGYDSSGNLASVTDANGNTTTYHYDLFDRLYQVIQPENATTTYTYDTHGNLVSVTDAEGHVTIYTYDDLGRLVNTESPDTGTTYYSYDKAGNLRFKVQNNKNIEYQYDLLGRLTDILYSDSTQNVTMTYDAGTGVNLVGRLASVTDPSGMVEYSYDDNGNVETVTRTINSAVFVTSYEYDNAGNLRTVIYPSGHTIDYQPDATYPALISGVVLDGSQQLAANITYSPFGPSKTMTLGNGIQTTKTYDKNYQVLTLSAGTTMDRTYIPDAVGNIEVITDNLDNNRTQSFGYDDFYRLTHATGIYGSIDFTYDLVGNRLSRNQTGPSSSNDTYNYYPDTNRLQTVVGDHAELIEYDADGNITARIPGASNRTPPVTGSSDYTYSSSGQRSQKAGATAVIYHYDLFGQLIAETDHQGNLIKAYVWLLGKPLAQIAANGSVYYYHNDHLGTPQKMTDGNGNVVWAADYLPFGKADVTIGIVENNLRLPGQYYDSETGLHYNWHRYYDPTIGRYLRADPLNFSSIINNDITFQKIYEITTNNKLPVYFYKSQLLDEIFTNPTALNPYIYANDNPIINIDSIGLQSKNVLNWIKKLKACKDCEEAISNPDGDEWDAFVRCKKCCKGLQRRSYFSVTPCEQACVEIWEEKHNKN